MTACYCIIGVDAAGFSALKEMQGAGFAVDCFEKTNHIGGHWNAEYDVPHTMTPRDGPGGDDFLSPTDYLLYPGCEQLVY